MVIWKKNTGYIQWWLRQYFLGGHLENYSVSQHLFVAYCYVACSQAIINA